MNPTTINPLALPSLSLANRSALPTCPAVYFALEGDRVLYVGRASNLQQRWTTHHRYSQLKGINNVRIAWLECSDPSLLPEIEAALIEYLQPELNGSPSPLPRIAVYLPPEIKLGLEIGAKNNRRTVSNMAAWIIEQWVMEAKNRGEIPETKSEAEGKGQQIA
jgi:hypothetical protein